MTKETDDLIFELYATASELDRQMDELRVFAQDQKVNVHKVCDHNGDLALAPLLVGKATVLGAITQLVVLRDKETE